MSRNVHNPQAVSDLPLFAAAAVARPLALPVHHGGLRQPSRNSDVETSHAAAKELRASGRLTRQCAETLTALVRFEWASHHSPTSFELAGDDLRLRYQYARRLPDLERLGFVIRLDSKRPCAVTGRDAFPWRVTEEGMKAFRQARDARKAEVVR